MIQCSEIAAIVVIIVIRHIDSILYSKHYLWVLDGIKRKHKVWFKIPASRQENRTCISVAGVILLKVYKFFPKKDQNQTTF